MKTGKFGSEKLRFLMAAVILIQVLSLGYLAHVKKQYFIDEIYSYILSNSYEADCILRSDLYGRWVTGEDFLPLATVQEGERFAYARTYYNNTMDAHPPFYYFLLHTVCSFFPGILSKWQGIGLNLVLFIVTQILLFRLSRKIFGSTLWALVPGVLYGSSLYAVNTAVLIRMYMLSALFTVLITYLHYRFVFEGERKKRYYAVFFLVTFLGVFTHYFFAVYTFFLAGATCVYLLVKKEFKPLFAYMAVMLSAVAAVFLVFPAGISQITGSETNNISEEVSHSISAVSELPGHLYRYFRQILDAVFAGLLAYRYVVLLIVLLTLAASAARAVIRKKKGIPEVKAEGKTGTAAAVLGGLLLLTYVLTAFLTGDFVYDRYFYNVIPLGCLFVTLLIFCFASLIRVDRSTVAVGVILVACVSLYTIVSRQYGMYLYPNSDLEKVIEDCREKPMILISEGTAFPTGNYELLSSCEHVYLSKTDDFDMKKVLDGVDTENGVCVMIFTDEYWGKAYDADRILNEVVADSDDLDTYYKYDDCTLGVIYVAQ